MRSFVASLVVALLLLGTGAVLWAAAARQEKVVEAERDLASLRFDLAAARLDELAASPSVLASLVPSLDTAAATSRTGALGEYWRANYDAVSGDQTYALLAANAAFRAIEREGGPWTAVVGKLDTVVKRYGDVLRSDPGNEDAAYNLEFVVRLRAAVAAARKPMLPVDPAASRRTLHGEAGAPPSTTDMKQFKMIVPMLPQERQEAEQAGRGTTRVRKG